MHYSIPVHIPCQAVAGIDEAQASRSASVKRTATFLVNWDKKNRIATTAVAAITISIKDNGTKYEICPIEKLLTSLLLFEQSMWNKEGYKIHLNASTSSTVRQ